MSQKGAGKENSIVAQAAADKAMWARGVKLMRFEEALEGLADDDLFVLNMTVKFPNQLKDGYTAVVRAENAAGKYVAFNGGETFEECLIGLINRMLNKSLVWREDKYA